LAVLGATWRSFSTKGLPADDAEHPVLVQRRVALHGEDVVAGISSMLSSSAPRPDARRRPSARADSRARSSTARRPWPADARERMKLSEQQVHSSPLQPDHRRARLGFHRVGDLRHEGGPRPSAEAVSVQIFHSTEAETFFRRTGITFNVYGAGRGGRTPDPLRHRAAHHLGPRMGEADARHRTARARHQRLPARHLPPAGNPARGPHPGGPDRRRTTPSCRR
jgi:hypothetical protein